jgi:hypothetical protein
MPGLLGHDGSDANPGLSISRRLRCEIVGERPLLAISMQLLV